MIICSVGVRDEEARLDRDISAYRQCTYARNTQRTYRSQRDAYFRFCIYFGYNPIPVKPRDLARYASFLARSLLPASVKCYLNVVRILHLEAGYPSPLKDNWFLHTVLLGIQRSNGTPPSQELPITPQVLLAMHAEIDLSKPENMAFWAACFCAFFTFFRKSTQVPKSLSHEDTKLSIARGDITLCSSYAILRVRHTKTIQFSDRTLDIPIPAIKDSPFIMLSKHREIGSRPPTNAICTYLCQFGLT